jgi:hypothetical protein
MDLSRGPEIALLFVSCVALTHESISLVYKNRRLIQVLQNEMSCEALASMAASSAVYALKTWLRKAITSSIPLGELNQCPP